MPRKLSDYELRPAKRGVRKDAGAVCRDKDVRSAQAAIERLVGRNDINRDQTLDMLRFLGRVLGVAENAAREGRYDYVRPDDDPEDDDGDPS